MSHEDNYFYDDFDDYDEADEALAKQIDEDAELSSKVQIHELAHALRERPLPGMPFSEEYRRRFRGAFPPFPAQPTVGELRNLFNEDACEDARKRARSDVPDIAWYGAKYLFWRNEAIGRYCMNVNCLAPLPEETCRRGRRRYYCAPHVDKSSANREQVDCKNAAIKRRKYHEAHPHAAQRLRPMFVPGIPWHSVRAGSSFGQGFIPPRTDYKAPWLDNEDADDRSGERIADLADHLRRWASRHKRRKPITARERRKSVNAQQKRRRADLEAVLGIPLETAVAFALYDGTVFDDDTTETIEELLGRSINALITSDDEHPDDDDGLPGTEPLSRI